MLGSGTGDLDFSNPLTMLVVLGTMALAPFLLTMVTSFVKIVVVGGIIRSALGTQQIPPTQVLTGLALIMTVYIMWPVGARIYQDFHAAAPVDIEIAGADDSDTSVSGNEGDEKEVAATKDSKPSSEKLMVFVNRAWDASRDPMREFLLRHTHRENLELFTKLQTDLAESYGVVGAEPVDGIISDEVQEMICLVPAFVISELTEAFQIGFLIFVPFLILDLVVSNLLLAMGMFMLSPTTVSLPLKLMLFVLVDGWVLIIDGLVKSYI